MSEIKLSKQQEAFAQEILKGKTQADAYRVAYPTSKKWKVDAIYSQASILINNSKVVARIEELRKPIQERLIKRFVKSKEDILLEMEEIKNSDSASNKDKLDVLKEQGKLLGYYIEKTEDLTKREYKETVVRFVDSRKE